MVWLSRNLMMINYNKSDIPGLAVEPGHPVLKHIVYSLEPWYLSHAPVRLFKDSTKKPFDYSKLQQAGACYCGNLLSIGHHPGNIRLDEDVLKTSFVFRRRLQDVLIKTNMFSSALRLQDVLVRPIYSSWLYVFKTFCQDVFKRSCQKFFKTSSRCIIKLNCSC